MFNKGYRIGSSIIFNDYHGVIYVFKIDNFESAIDMHSKCNWKRYALNTNMLSFSVIEGNGKFLVKDSEGDCLSFEFEYAAEAQERADELNEEYGYEPTSDN